MAKVLINIDVPDLARAERFYGQAFGLTPGRRFGADVVELLGFEAPLYLLRKGEATVPFASANSQRRYERHWTPVHLDVVVEDIDAALTRAAAAGAVIERNVAENSWGKIAVLADPFGNGFCLIEFVGRGYDEIAD